MKRELWNAEHKCTNCNIIMKKKKLVVEGIDVRGWECPKCKETVLHPEDAQRMFVFNKLKRGLSIRIGSLGQSLIMRIPKEVAEFYNITKGEDIVLKAEDLKKLELTVPA